MSVQASPFDDLIDKARTQGFISAILAVLRIVLRNRAYFLNPYARRHSKLPARNDAAICAGFQSLGVALIPYTIDLDDFHRWLEAARFPESFVEACVDCQDLWSELFMEKALEYYVSASLLGLNETDTLLDVGASYSPWHTMAERIYGCAGYALDRKFTPGVRGREIGADATNIPLPNGFATKIALHSAYEQFEGTADIRFLSEAHRVLRDSGKMVILPLWMDNSYYALVYPFADTRGLDCDGAKVVWDDHRWPIRFERFYSVEAFNERVIQNLSGFTLTIFYFQNAHEIAPNLIWPKYYLRFAALCEKVSVANE